MWQAPPGETGPASWRLGEAFGHGERGGTGIGRVEGNVIVHQYAAALPRLPRSAYLQQVKRIAPPQLWNRDVELAELATFCLQEQPGPYVWWQAGPWAGKSALMSTFVLHPPEQLAGRVWLVSFFITARLAAQDTRDAFTEALTEQLCALLGQNLPVAASEATREAALQDLLEQAATACRSGGGRLVLVVDGMDEDRGVTLGPHAHSIAALLPGQPPAGMRLIVSGRPHPPIPDDVPSWHPLRDPGIIRLLGPSPHAQDLKRLGESELKRLLKGTPLEQDLLGLLTAARGGLAGPELHQLTGADLVVIEDVLHTVAGRTFASRVSRWAPRDRPPVYLFGHEELQQAASHYLGATRLAGYRTRLHSWADTYRASRDGQPPWPPGTPEYLLSGYPRMLAAIGDADRLVALTVDPARHDRMLDLSGSDAAALTEIKACQDLLLSYPQPDLYALARLSHHRCRLEDRNARIPVDLPAVWARLGHPRRAEALAQSIPDPGQQAKALTAVAAAVAAAGDPDRATAVATRAEQVARSITDPLGQAIALGEMAKEAAAAGDPDRAEQLARSITDPDQRVWHLVDLAKAAGDLDRAEQVAGSITDQVRQARALGDVAAEVAAAGDLDRAMTVATRAEQIARSITDPDRQGLALGAVAAAVAGYLAHAERMARSITDPGRHEQALSAVAAAVAAAGDPDHAEQIARSITEGWQAQALIAVATAVAAAGDPDRAERVARSITSPGRHASALAAVAKALAAAGDPDGAERVARSITDPVQHVMPALRDVAKAMAAAGDLNRAEQFARSIPDAGWRAAALSDVAEALAAVGDLDRAEHVARSITDPGWRARALGAVAAAVAAAGELDRAMTVATHAEQIARSITDPDQQAKTLAVVAGAVAKAMAATGDPDGAEHIARSITDPNGQAQALVGVAKALAAAGDSDRAMTVAARAEQVASSITDRVLQTHALVGVAGAMAAAGAPDRAEQTAMSITDQVEQARALCAVATAVAAAGDLDKAMAVATRAGQIAWPITNPYMQAQAMAAAAEAAATAGDPDLAMAVAIRAEQVARSHPNNPLGQAWTLGTVAAAVAAAGDLDHAEQIARSIALPNFHPPALRGVARAMAAAGDPDRAEQIARSITDPGWRASALTALAEVLGLSGSIRLLGEAFTLGSWSAPLPALAELDPALLLRIADAVS